MKVYSSAKSWIEPASFLWASVLFEVKRQHREVDLEIYGRWLDAQEQRALNEIVELYMRHRDPRTGRISQADLLKIAEHADHLGMKPHELLGKEGRKCLSDVNRRNEKSIATVSEIVRQRYRLPIHTRSLQGFLRKFLSDALRDQRSIA